MYLPCSLAGDSDCAVGYIEPDARSAPSPVAGFNGLAFKLLGEVAALARCHALLAPVHLFNGG